MSIQRWYISGAAVRDWQRIARLPRVDDGPEFDAAAAALEAVAAEARMLREDGFTQTWQAKPRLHGKVARLTLTVSTAPRPEGPLPQLVRVRQMGGSRSGRKRTAAASAPASPPKGHWPAGKRRHDELAARSVLAAFRRLLEREHTGPSTTIDDGDRVSVRAAAVAIEVSDRTVRRWLSGEDVPAADHVRRLQDWIAGRTQR